MKELGLAVSTYSNDKTSKERLIVIKESLDSIVKNTPDNCYLCIIDDGSTNEEHLNYLENLKKDGIEIIRRHTNGGVSYAKNIAIDNLLKKGISFGFLVDDDLIIKDSSFAQNYFDAHKKTGIDHFNLIVKIFHPPILDINGNIKKDCIKNYKGIDLLISPLVDGSLLTFTPRMIKKIGYYEIYPYKYGQSHVNYTYRAINQGFTAGLKFVDVYGSDNYFSTNPLSYRNFADPYVNRKEHSTYNARFLQKNLDKYINPTF